MAIASRVVWIPPMAFLAIQFALYAAFPVPYDHGDIAVASIGAALRSGQLAYSGLEYGADFYSLPYGPLLYELQGIFTAPWPFIFSTKLPGLIAFSVGCAAIGMMFRRESRALAAPFCALAALILIRNLYYEFGVRAESLLFGLTGVVTLAVLRTQGSRTKLFVGAAAGFAAQLKINAVAFFLPHALAIVFANRDPKSMAINTLQIVVTMFAAFVIPLLAPGINFTGYFEQLLLSARVGLSLPGFIDGALELTVISSPVVALFLARRTRLTRGEEAALFGSAIAGFVTVVVASKFGSETNPLIPLIPISAGLSIMLARDVPLEMLEDISRKLTIAVFALALAYTPFLAVHVGELRTHLKMYADRTLAVGEAQQIYVKYPGAQMGVGGDEPQYELAGARMIGPLRGAHLQFDPAAWMEFAYVEQNRAEAMSLVFVENCRVKYWILPAAGAPFSMRSYYVDAPFFTPVFVAAFKQNYEMVERTPHFTVWACHPT
jgi:hypothetical protein